MSIRRLSGRTSSGVNFRAYVGGFNFKGADFPGCTVIISHDRWFLDRLCTHILAFEGDSHVEWFEGNFEAYEEDKKRRLGADSLIPHRIKFQKFARA
jgi:hypothetical protein